MLEQGDEPLRTRQQNDGSLTCQVAATASAAVVIAAAPAVAISVPVPAHHGVARLLGQAHQLYNSTAILLTSVVNLALLWRHLPDAYPGM